MKFYVSQLVETEKILPVLKKYNVGLEVVQFANPYILDNRYEFVESYKKELGDLYGKVDLIIHGPYADLAPGTRDNLIRDITSYRMNQCYEVARELNAKKVVFHDGFIPNTYIDVEWKKNSFDYWKKFLKGKNLPIVVENVLDEEYGVIRDLVKEIDDDKLKICLDVGHVNAYSHIDVFQWIDSLKDNIHHIHLHNNFGDRDSHLHINKGNMDVFKILHELKKIDREITVSLEIIDLDEMIDSLEILVEKGFIEYRK